MAYVPPALRRKQEAAAAAPAAEHQDSFRKPGSADSMVDDAPKNLPSVYDIQRHFWPPVQTSDVDANRQESDIRSSSQAHSTLNGTAETPDSLKYILLFSGAVGRSLHQTFSILT